MDRPLLSFFYEFNIQVIHILNETIKEALKLLFLENMNSSYGCYLTWELFQIKQTKKYLKRLHDSGVTELSEWFLLPIFLGDIFVVDVSTDVSVWWTDALAANILKVL